MLASVITRFFFLTQWSFYNLTVILLILRYLNFSFILQLVGAFIAGESNYPQQQAKIDDFDIMNLTTMRF